MEGEVARRRINKIAAHFVALTSDDIISSTTHLLPMKCSGGLNSVIRRCGNRRYFARQSAASQACFMRPVSSEHSTTVSNASQQPLFARPGTGSNGPCYASEAPLFSRPARMEPEYPNFALPRPALLQDCKFSTADDHPKFAKPDGRIGKQDKYLCLKRNIYSAKANGIEGYPTPRMVVSELGCNYVMTVEIPGVSINDIRVEVHDQNLTVTAKRSTQCWKVEGCSDGSSISAYQRRKYTEEPYRVFWPLPTDVNKETVSAEFLDGLLRIIIPKKN
ncbi:hypothetical protein Ddye_032754 [Dipteronia dyeriana]|uniref:SHSP domain-containing protein n=1 Tax=Dipteronia dyeriana TaxID=168575 RepID=A0AAD9TCT0_9ROSI|nr:hypothetical protein Ddye_032754 [Dipteronia dyeriana]